MPQNTIGAVIIDCELPPELTGPAVWYGPQMAAQGDWLLHFSAAEVTELEAAALTLTERGGDATTLGPADCALPLLAPRLAEWRAEVLRGRGFVLLRGLPVQRWSQSLAEWAFIALGLHLGRALPQNAQGELLGHVRDMGLHSSDPRVRIYQTAERQSFHTDSCDIVGLLCLQAAHEGGQSALVSSATLWNEMRRRRPDLARLLLQPIATDRRGEVPAGSKPYFEIPVFNWFAGEMSAIYQRQYIDSAQRFDTALRLSPAHVEALDLLDALADDPAHHFLMTLQPGDVQLVHNHSLLHDRTAFSDPPQATRRRHLLRLWLAPADARALPAVFAQRYGSVLPGARGGVRAAAADSAG